MVAFQFSRGFALDNALSPTFKLGSINLNYEFSEAFELLSSIANDTDEGYLRSHIKDAGCSRFDNAVVFEYWTAGYIYLRLLTLPHALPLYSNQSATTT